MFINFLFNTNVDYFHAGTKKKVQMEQKTEQALQKFVSLTTKLQEQ